MSGHVLRTVQLDAASRALSMYRTMGLPRRVFSCLIHLTRHHVAMHDAAAAQAAADEARRMLQPDWPAEFPILLLRVDGSLAGLAGRGAETVALCREAARSSATTGDWRLEVIARNNLVNALWQVGPIDDAVAEASRLADELRVRPAADPDIAVLFANLIGILSETGRIDEALAAAREALPAMRRARYLYIEEWVYLFWRLGLHESAALLLGASDAERARFGTPHQENERRLIGAARAALQAQLPPAAFASTLASGAGFDVAKCLAVIDEALARCPERTATG
jgi:hypothetical protein